MRSHAYTRDRFRDFREIRAQFASRGACGHSIVVGDAVGWNPRARRVVCAACWLRWQQENAVTSAVEAGYGVCPW